MVAMPGEKYSQLKARLSQLDKAIEKQGILDNLVQKLDKKGLMTPNIEAGVDTSMLVRDGARDNYVSLNQKLDKALGYVKNRLLTNKAAYAKPKGVDEGKSNAMTSVASRLSNKDDGKVAKLRVAGDKRREDQLKGRDIAKRDATGKDDWGNLKDYGAEGVAEEKQRLDPSCWKGYKKQGTKMKGDTRVNNCVPIKESSIFTGLKKV